MHRPAFSRAWRFAATSESVGFFGEAFHHFRRPIEMHCHNGFPFQ